MTGATVCLSPDRRDPFQVACIPPAAFSSEMPAKPTAQAGDLFLACSDYPHSEGTADPIAGYTGAPCGPASNAGLFHDNVALLLDRR